MNKVILIGRLTADPELRQTQSGISSCRFTVACNRQYKNETTGDYDADFISCIAWRQTAEFINKYFSKGKMIVAEGSMRNNNYQDKKYSDVMHYSYVCTVDKVEFAGDKGGGNTGQAPAQQTPAQSTANKDEVMSYSDLSDFEEILSDGDVPF